MREINRFLRGLFITIGALFLLLDLLPKAKALQDTKEGFDNEEFDDIW